MRKVFGVLCTLVFCTLLLVPQTGECYVTLRYKDVPAGFLQMKLPADTYIIKYVFDELNELVPANEYRNREDIKKSAFSLYQLALEDGDSYKTAWVVAFSDSKQLKEEEIVYFNDLTQERKDEILARQAMIKEELQLTIGKNQPAKIDFSEIRKVYFYQSMSKRYIEVLNFSWPDVEFPIIAGKQAFTSEGRLAANFYGFFAAGYAKGYVLSVDDKGFALAFLCMDSEKEFWQEIMDRAVTTVR